MNGNYYIPPSLRAVFCDEIADNMTKIHEERFTIWIRSLPANVTISLLGTSRRSQCVLFCRLLILCTTYTEMRGYEIITETTSETLGLATQQKQGRQGILTTISWKMVETSRTYYILDGTFAVSFSFSLTNSSLSMRVESNRSMSQIYIQRVDHERIARYEQRNS